MNYKSFSFYVPQNPTFSSVHVQILSSMSQIGQSYYSWVTLAATDFNKINCSVTSPAVFNDFIPMYGDGRSHFCLPLS